jgi:hypothetical protein
MTWVQETWSTNVRSSSSSAGASALNVAVRADLSALCVPPYRGASHSQMVNHDYRTMNGLGTKAGTAVPVASNDDPMKLTVRPGGTVASHHQLGRAKEDPLMPKAPRQQR